MELKRQQLAEGVYLNYIPTEKFKAGFIQMRFILPMQKETASKNALLFHVMQRGSEKYPNLTAMRKRGDELYDSHLSAGCWKYGDSQVISLECSPLGQKYAIDDTDITAGVIDLMEDVLLHPVTEDGVFKAEYVEGEKIQLIGRARSIINNKGQYAATRATEVMFEGDPFGIRDIGTPEDIEKVCPKCLYEQYLTVLKTARVEIFAVGSYDEKYLAKRFSEIFSGINRGDVYSPATTPLSAERTGEIKKVYERQNVTQGKLVLGFRTGCDRSCDDFYLMKLFNEIFGGSACSKLFMNVREKLSLCYYCSSSLLSEKGAMIIHSGIEFANEQKAVDEINVQLEKMKSGDITDEEIDNAKKSLCDGILGNEDSTRAMAGWFFGNIMTGQTTTPEQAMDEIKSATKEQIVEKAKKVTLDTYYFLCGEEKAQ